MLGAGSGEILTNAVRAFTSPSKPLATPWPSFENPRDTAKKIGTAVQARSKLDNKLRIDIDKTVEASKGAGLVFFCNPNNPTATVHGASAVADFVKRVRAASPDTVILIDEAYHDYVTDPSYKTADGHRASPRRTCSWRGRCRRPTAWPVCASATRSATRRRSTP